MDRSRWPFWHFKVLLLVNAVKAGEGVVLMPLDAHSQDAAMVPHVPSCEQTA